MSVLIYSVHDFEKETLCSALDNLGLDHASTEAGLDEKTASMAKGHDAVCVFVNDDLGEKVIEKLYDNGVRLILLRSAGFNHVDLAACERYGVRVMRVPEYSPYSVAEYTITLLQTLNRKTHRAFNRIRELNFSLNHLVGFDLHGKTVGVIGTGKIGAQVCRILHGFGCRVLAYDVDHNPKLIEDGCVTYVSFDEVVKSSKVLTLHLPLNAKTFHLIDKHAFEQMPDGAILINTSRGGLVDTCALIKQLKTGRLGGAALDVYEEEEKVFFTDRSFAGLEDDVLARLLTFPNVILTSHQAFLTREALVAIGETTASNYLTWLQQKEDELFENEVLARGNV